MANVTIQYADLNVANALVYLTSVVDAGLISFKQTGIYFQNGATHIFKPYAQVIDIQGAESFEDRVM